MRLSFFLFLHLILLSNNSFSIQTAETDSLFVSEIKISGNSVTKDKIIERELLFYREEKVKKENLAELIRKSRENLLNTSLFNFVTINYQIIDDRISFQIDLQERWYIWPYPVLEQADRNLSAFFKNQEWSRVDYGLFVLINNFRGRKEILKLKSIFGYNNRFVLYYNKPFIDKKQKLGAGFDVDYYRNHELPYQVINDQLEYLKLSDVFLRKTLKLSTFLTYRPYIYSSHFLNFKYSNVSVSDTVIALNSNYFLDDATDLEFFSLAYIYDFDHRDSKIYPLDGFRFFISLEKNGLGIISKEGTFNTLSIVEENFKIANRLYFNTGLLGKVDFEKNNSFYFTEAIGYKNYIRGMEYYVTHGSSYILNKSNLKFEIIPQTRLDINFIPSDKFSKAHYALYLNLFFDSGYVDSQWNLTNKLTNQFLYSGGIGVDLVTYYDKVLRIEYSVNKFGENGIFFHLGAPIIED